MQQHNRVVLLKEKFKGKRLTWKESVSLDMPVSCIDSWEYDREFKAFVPVDSLRTWSGSRRHRGRSFFSQRNADPPCGRQEPLLVHRLELPVFHL